MLISTFGDVGTVISISFHQLNKKDYAIVAAANAAISVSLLFVSSGTAMLISLGLKTQVIYEISTSVFHIMKKERANHIYHNYDCLGG